MSVPMGPQGMLRDFEALAERYYQQILSKARASVDSNLTIEGMSVEDEAEPLLKRKLTAIGFSKVHFHSTQRDGDEVYLEGNPFSEGNILRDAQLYVSQINRLLQGKTLEQRRITVTLDVPSPVQAEVRRLFTQPNVGWKKVEFTSDYEGKYVTLSI